jgi:hypothetical protein
VKRRKLQDERSQAKELEQDRHKGRIQRSKIVGHNLCGGLLAREAGAKLAPLDFAAIYASGLVEQGHLAASGDSMFIVKPRRDLGPSCE